MVIIGAASEKLPVKGETLKEAISDLFASKGKDIVDINIRAFELEGKNRIPHDAGSLNKALKIWLCLRQYSHMIFI